MKKGKNRIAIVICYIGRLPWYFKYFVHSCQFNPSIDFFVVTDDTTYKDELPRNVHLKFSSLAQLSEIASEILSHPVQIRYAYKLCDFKPLYGLLFSEVLEGYEFWGYGDLDVIYGDISRFITPAILEAYDIISVRHDFLTGYFQLFRNNHDTRNLFSQSRDFMKVFSSDTHYCFDETNFMHQAFNDNQDWREIVCEIDSMMHVVCRLRDQGMLRCYFDFHVIEGLPGKLAWNKGKLFYNKQYEILLYHMIKFKAEGFEKRKLKSTTSSFKISPQMIY